VIPGVPYHVFLTQYDGDYGLYVPERDGSGFAVRSARSADAECEFSYRVTAKRKDAAEVRFEEAQEPEGETLPELPAARPADAGCSLSSPTSGDDGGPTAVICTMFVRADRGSASHERPTQRGHRPYLRSANLQPLGSLASPRPLPCSP
jgi:hypothetical protein